MFKKGYLESGNAHHIQSSLPCQGFSLANRGGKNDDCNNALSRKTIKAVKFLKPCTGIMENVGGMLRPKHLKHVITMLLDLINLECQVRIASHNSMSHGALTEIEKQTTFFYHQIKILHNPLFD